MRLIDADALKSDHNMGDECNKCKTKWRECQYDYIYSKMDFCTWIDDAPTIDAVPIDYIMQRADVLKETDEYGARVLYGIVMNWNGEVQNDEID